MYRRASAILSIALLAAAAPAAEQTTKPAPKATKAPVVSRGPIKITAERADLEQRETALYRGNVKLTSAELTLTGDRLELKQPSRGEFEAKLTGAPAHLSHAGNGEIAPVKASAAQIVYDTRTSVVDLTGGVQLERGTDTLSSDSLSYNIEARRISAAGVGKGQVEITIQPQDVPSQEKPAPVPQNTPR
jgi:lipopolysaccharide export system protein LptA